MRLPSVQAAGTATLIALALVAAGCSPTFTSVPTPTPGPTAMPTPTRAPTSTPEPIGTPTATPTPIPTLSPEFRVGLAKHLHSVGAVVYVGEGCGWCDLQKEMFGAAVQYLDIVYCSGSREVNPQPSLCRTKGVAATPTWEINGELYPGCMYLEALAELSGYTYPTPTPTASP